MTSRVAVIGAFHTMPDDAKDQKLEDLVFAAARGALADAGLGVDELDAVVISTDDQAHGRVIESMVMAGSVAAVGRDLTTVPSAGEHALVYAWMRLMAGEGRRVLVVCWGRPSESKDPHHAELVTAEPFLLRPYGMNNSLASALQASVYAGKHGLDRAAIESVRAQRAAAATRYFNAEMDRDPGGLVAWPLHAADLPRLADMAAAVVLSSADGVTDQDATAWITGVGWASNAYDLGARDLSRYASLERAVGMADPDGTKVSSANVIEVVEPSTIGAFAVVESLGLADSGRGPRLLADQRISINPSGGNLPVHPGNAAGFMRMLMAAQQVRGRAGPAQLESRADSAVGASLSGFAGQLATVAIFNSKPEVQ